MPAKNSKSTKNSNPHKDLAEINFPKDLVKTQPNLFSKLSNFFLNNYRISISIFLAILVAGTLAYTTFLPKEGFPPVQVSTSIISTSYIVNDSELVNEEVTLPIEEAVSEIKGVKSISSTTTFNNSNINVFWDEDIDLEEVNQELQKAVENINGLPENIEIDYIQPDVNKFLNEFDAVVGIYSTSEQDLKEVQKEAENFASFIEVNDQISEAEMIPTITEQVDQSTKATFDFQDSFNRVGIQDGEEIIFYDTVQVGVNKEETADALKLSEAINEEINNYKSESDNFNFEFIMQGDNAVRIRSDLDNLQQSIFIGMFITLLVVLLLISWKAGIVIAIFIPMVMSFVFLRLWMLGLSLNTISFFGLIVALGLFVDDATVVVESIYTYKSKGKTNRESIVLAIKDIGMASFVGSLTTILVFAPMFFVSGILGSFIIELPISVILSLIASFLLSLTFIPFVINIFLTKSKQEKKDPDSKKIKTPGDFVDFVGKFLAQIVRNIQKNRTTGTLTIGSVFIFTLILFLVGIFNLQSVPFDTFAEQKDSDEIILSITYPEKTDIQTAQKIATDVENLVLDELDDNLKSVSYTNGDQRKATMLLGIKSMNERSETTAEMVSRLNSKLESESRANVFTAVQGSARSQGAGDQFTFSLNIQGSNTEAVVNAAKEIEAFVTDLEIDSTDGEKVLDTRIENIATIAKLDKIPFVTLKAYLTSDTTEVTSALREQIENEFDAEKLESLGLESNALQEDPNSTESRFNESLISLGINFAVVSVIMYFILMILYKSFSQPILIFLAPLFSLPGIFIGLSITDNALGFFPILGLLGLFGIAVNNIIVLVDLANSERANGKNIINSIADALEARFRSIFTTTLTTIAALSVMLSDPFWQSLAVTMISGLISSVILVVLLFPYFYIASEFIRQKKNAMFSWLK